MRPTVTSPRDPLAGVPGEVDLDQLQPLSVNY